MNKGILATLILAVLGIVMWALLSESAPEAPVTPPVVEATPPAPAAEPPAPAVDVAPPVAAKRVEAAPEKIDPHALPLPERYRAALAKVKGRLVEPEGAPVPDMKVELLALELDDVATDPTTVFNALTGLSPIKGATRSDKEGRFEFAGLEPGAMHVLGLDLKGERPGIRFIDQSPAPGQTIDLGDVVLEPFVVFKGIVVDSAGKPVEAARVRATLIPAVAFQFGAQDFRPDGGIVARMEREPQLLEWPAWAADLAERLPIPTTATGADGRFELRGVPCGLATVVVDKVDFKTFVNPPIPTGSSGERDLGHLTLDDGETIAGSVVDAAGKPVAGCEVMAGESHDMMGQFAVMRRFPTTDAAGKFACRGVGDEDHIVAVRAPGQAEWLVQSEVSPGSENVVLKLQPAFDLKLIARDVEHDRKIVPRPDVLVQRDFEPAEVAMVAPPRSDVGQRRYEDDGSVTVAGLTAAKYRVLARAPGFAMAFARVDLTAGAQTVELEFEPTMSISVKVTASDDKQPIEYARVSVTPPRQDRDHRPFEMMRADRKRTDAKGEAVLENVHPGKVRICAEHPGFASIQKDVEIKAAGDRFELVLPAGGSIHGKVHEGPKPAEPRFIVADRRGDGGEEFPRFAFSDLEGGFEVRRLPAGTYRLEVLRRWATQGIGKVTGSFDPDSFQQERSLTVEVKDGEATEVDIDLLGSGITGPVARVYGRVIKNGLPAEGVTVSFDPQEDWEHRKHAKTDAGGNFDLGEVPAAKGWLNVTMSAEGGRADSNLNRNLELQPNEAKEIVITIDTGRVVGTVSRKSDGARMPGVRVSAQPAPDPQNAELGFGGWQMTVTDKNGEFTFDEVQAGKVMVRVDAEGYVETSVGPIAVVAHAEAPPVKIEIDTGVEIEGFVATKEALSGDRLFLWIQSAEPGIDVSSSATVEMKSGKFKFAAVRPGKYSLQGWNSEGTPYSAAEFVVPEGGLHDFRLELTKVAQQPVQTEGG